jgi:hypothetical protein
MMTGKLGASIEEVLSSKQASEKSEPSASREGNDAEHASSNFLPLTCKGDLVSLTMQSHASGEILVIFAANT